MFKIKVVALTALAAFAVGAQQAHAVSIQGTIDIGALGSHLIINKTANTVDFVDDVVALPGNAIVANGEGNFAGLIGTPATYQDFTYSPLTVVNPLWSLIGPSVSFDLLAITSIDETGAGLVLTGTGTVHAAGFDDTPGVWSFSADTTASIASTARFTFSSQSAAVATPDGGATAMMLGVGVLGMAGLRRKLR